jgi:hypothetical protein
MQSEPGNASRGLSAEVAPVQCLDWVPLTVCAAAFAYWVWDKSDWQMLGHKETWKKK